MYQPVSISYFLGNELRKKWKNLRTCFKREYDAQKVVAPGSRAKKRHIYIYFEQLLFLRDSVECRITSNSRQKNNGNEDENNMKKESEKSQKSKEMHTDSSARRIVKTKRRKSANEVALPQILKTTRDEDNEIDEDKYFLLSLLPSFKKFNDDQKFIVRMEIMNVMRRVRLSESSGLHHLRRDGQGPTFFQITKEDQLNMMHVLPGNRQ